MGSNFFIDKMATHIDTVERDEKKSQTPWMVHYRKIWYTIR
jgi:hypothetical protein